MKRLFRHILTCLLLVATPALAEPPRNVILLVGDGMGFEQVRAASLFAHGQEGRLTMEQLPHRGEVVTASADNAVTDSAAGASAMATGHKVNNGVLSLAVPGDAQPYETILEQFAVEGKATGLVSTAHLTHATPAGFASHVGERSAYQSIGQQILGRTQPDLLLGGGGVGLSPDLAEARGYTVVTDRRGLESLDLAQVDRLAGLFGQGYMPYEFDYLMRIDPGYDRLPHLSEMTRAALEMLGRHEEGLFLMIEGARIDHAGHSNLSQNSVHETLEFDNAVREVMTWVHGRDDTLVIVTADHETGDLRVVEGRGRGVYPQMQWHSGGHTGVNVPIFAWGVGAETVQGVIDNTDIYRIMMGMEPQGPAEAAPQATESEPEPEPAMAPAAGDGGY